MTFEMYLFAAFLLVIPTLGLIAFVRWLFFTPKSEKVSVSAMPDPTSISSPPPALDALDSVKLSGREAQDVKIKERLRTGLCLFCDERAHLQMPTYQPQRSLLDRLYRTLNVVPLDRYKIVLDRGTSAPYALCQKHHERVRGLFEKRISKAAADTADFFDDTRLSLYVFERYEVYERVDGDMNIAKRGRKGVPLPKSNNVVTLQSVKKSADQGS